MTEAPEDLRKKRYSRNSRTWLRRSLERRSNCWRKKKQKFEEMLKERRCAEVEEGIDTIIAGSGVTRKAAVGPQRS